MRSGCPSGGTTKSFGRSAGGQRPGRSPINAASGVSQRLGGHATIVATGGRARQRCASLLDRRQRGRQGCASAPSGRPAAADVSVTPTEPTSASQTSLKQKRRTGTPSLERRCSEAGALRLEGQIARATRGRDLHLNVPFPREPPDLLMAESPPTGGLSALTREQPQPLLRGACPALTAGGSSSILSADSTGAKAARTAADQGRMSFSVAVNRSPDSSSSPSMCRRAGPVSVHRSRK